MRLRNTAGQLEELGEDADGAAESITKLQTQLLNLTQGRVDIMLDPSTFKSTYNILLEISEVWGDLSDTTRAEVTRLVAGVRQGNVFTALMTNMDDAVKATAISMDSFGSAVKENERFLDSIEGRIAQFTAAFQDLSIALIDTGLVKEIVNMGTGLVGLIKSFTPIIEFLARPAFAIILTQTVGMLGRWLVTSIPNLFSNVTNLAVAFKGVGNSAQGVEGRIRGIKTEVNDTIHSVNRLNNALSNTQNAVRGATSAAPTSEQPGVDVSGAGTSNIPVSNPEAIAHTQRGRQIGMAIGMAAVTTMHSVFLSYASSKAASDFSQHMGNTFSNAISGAISGGMAGYQIGGAKGAAIGALVGGFTSVVSSIIGWNSGESERTAKALEEAADAASKAIEAYENFIDKSKTNISTLSSLQKEFDRLSQGVDSYGANLSLTSQEYDRYKDIVKTVVGISPELIAGYDAEGNAIANKNSLLERSIELIEHEQKLKLQEHLSNDSFDQQASIQLQKLSELNNAIKEATTVTSSQFSSAIERDHINFMLGLMRDGAWADELQNVSDYVVNAYLKMSGIPTFPEEYISNITDAVNNAVDSYQRLITKNDEIQRDINSTLQLVPQVVEGYAEMSGAQKNFITNYINTNRNTGESEEEIAAQSQAARDSIIELTKAMAALPIETQNLFEEMLSPDKINLTAKVWQEQINTSFNEIIKQLNDALETPLSDEQILMLKLSLNMVVVDDNGNQVDSAEAIASIIAEKFHKSMSSGMTQALSSEGLYLAEMLSNKFNLSDLNFFNLNSSDFDFSRIDFSNMEKYITTQRELISNNERMAKLASIEKKVANETSLLTKAMHEQASTGRLSADTINQLQNSFEKYSDIINVTTNGVELNTDKTKEYWNELIKANIETAAAAGLSLNFVAELGSLLFALDEVTKSLSDWGKEVIDAVSKSASLSVAFDSLKESGKIDPDSLKAITDILPEAVALAADFDEMLNFIAGSITDIDEEGVRALGNITWQTEAAVNSIINQNESLVEALKRFYREDLRNFKIMSDGKLKADEATIKDLYRIWGEYSHMNLLAATAQLAALKSPENLDAIGLGMSVDREREIRNVELYIEMLQAQADRFNSIVVDKKTGGSGGGGSSSNASDWLAEINELYKAEERLRRAQEDRTRAEVGRDNSQYYDEQIKFSKLAVSFMEEEQAALKALADLRRSIVGRDTTRLRSLGFNIDYNANTDRFLIHNWERVNELAPDVRREIDDLIKSTISMNEAAAEASTSLMQLHKTMEDGRFNIYRQWLDKATADIDILSITDADRRIVISSLQVVIAGIQAEIARLPDKLSDTYRLLEKDLSDAKNNMKRAFDEIVDNAMSKLNDITGVYTSLKAAAVEYAESGFITVDTFQKILSHGTEYLALLYDEAGQLTINRERIEDIIAARVNQLALEAALNHIEAARIAHMSGEAEELQRLLFATNDATDATWGLAYAKMKLIGLGGENEEALMRQINAFRSLADIAVHSIGKNTGSISDGLKSDRDALDQLIKYVMDMIRQETRTQVEGIREQVTAFNDLIAVRKENLREMQRTRDFEKSMAKQANDLVKLQTELALLERDNSNDPAIVAKRRQLSEQIAELQGKVDEDIHNKYIQEMETAYDHDAKLFAQAADEKIKILEDSISSHQKLWDLAIDRINTGWDTLYRDLYDWNYQYGNSLTKDLADAWSLASAAILKYGSYLEALLRTQEQLNALTAGNSTDGIGSPNVVAPTGNYDTTPNDSANLQANKAIAEQLRQKMMANSAAWYSADAKQQEALHEENRELARQIEKLLGLSIVYRATGWHIGSSSGPPLYSYKFHSGGIVGDGGVLSNTKQKDNEVLALLEKGEAVLTDAQKNTMYKMIDLSTYMMERFGRVIEDFSPLMTGGINTINAVRKADTDKIMESVTAGAHGSAVSIDRLEVPVSIMVVERLDEGDIRKFSKAISGIATDAMREEFRGIGILNKGSLTPRI